MNCHFRDQALQAVMGYLRRTGQTLNFSGSVYSLARGEVDEKIVEKAFNANAVSLAFNGVIRIGGVEIPIGWDIARIRRRVEDYLRKKASGEEIIRIAVCLNVRLR